MGENYNKHNTHPYVCAKIQVCYTVLAILCTHMVITVAIGGRWLPIIKYADNNRCIDNVTCQKYIAIYVCQMIIHLTQNIYLQL